MTTKAEREKRVYEVLLLITAGYQREEIIKYAESKQWETSLRAIDRYIADATKKSIAETAKNFDKNYALAITRLEQLYKNSFKINDFKTCADIVIKEAKLQGLDQPTQVNVSITDADDIRRRIDAAIRADPENRDRIVAELEKDEE